MCRQGLTGKRKFALILLSKPTSPNTREFTLNHASRLNILPKKSSSLSHAKLAVNDTNEGRKPRDDASKSKQSDHGGHA